MKRAFAYFSLILLLALSGCNNRGELMKFGNMSIYYKDGITAMDVVTLNEYLEKTGFYTNDGVERAIQLVREGNTYQFRMPVKKGIEQDQEYSDEFIRVAYQLSQDVFHGMPVEVHACDEDFKTLRVFLMKQ